MATLWDPERVFGGESSGFGLMVLNTPISDADFLLKLWSKASLRVLVDGATNRWHALVMSKLKARSTYSTQESDGVQVSRFCSLPDYIMGDADSLDKELIAIYRDALCVPIFLTPDQDYTDFTKALQFLSDKQQTDSSLPLEALCVYAESSPATGRPDHVFANYNTLLTALNIPSLPPVFLITSRSIEWVLPPGHHQIRVPAQPHLHCGLIPLGATPCTAVTTTGFRWNLHNDELAFGKLISTSNEFEAGATHATIHSPNAPLLFTLQMALEM